MSRDQSRAQIAFQQITNVLAGNPDPGFRKKYSTRCRKMPSILHRSGLCQAVAFYEANALAPPGASPSSQEASAFRMYLDGLSSAVLLSSPADQRTRQQLATFARTKPFGEYQWLSREAMECAVWFKRYAEALIGKEDDS